MASGPLPTGACVLTTEMFEGGDLAVQQSIHSAKERWLKPAEVADILVGSVSLDTVVISDEVWPQVSFCHTLTHGSWIAGPEPTSEWLSFLVQQECDQTVEE